MFVEIFLRSLSLVIGTETALLKKRNDSKTRCYLKRSNAMYKPKRPVLKIEPSKYRRSARRRRSSVGKCKNTKRRQSVRKQDTKFLQVPKKNKGKKTGHLSPISWMFKWKKRKIFPCSNLTLQEIDGGFFEKFGSLLRENSEIANVNEQLQQTKAAEEAARVIEQLPEINEDNVSGPDSETSSSDSENDEKNQTEDYLACALNIDELYSEILYEIIHNVGCDESCEINQSDLIAYLQEAFKMSPSKHSLLMEEAEQKEPPEILLNVEVMEAKDLMAKDANGLSDPFVTLYLSSNTSHKYNTSVKTATLNPSWEEHFALPIATNSNEDCLFLEVWDFDPAETVKEKFGKLFDVKGVKGIRKLVKEIAVTAATGQHTNELIGKTKIPLSTIPTSGLQMWYPLEKKNKASRRGVLKLRLTFSSEKNSRVAAQEHRHLLRILLLYELEMSKVTPYWWGGNFSHPANTILTRHIVQSGLQTFDIALTQWAVYTSIHVDHRLSFALFSSLLDKLIRPMQNDIGIEEESRKLFWDSTKRLLPSVFSIIRKIRRKNSSEKMTMKQLVEVLNVLSKISMLEPPEGTDLFPERLYPWLKVDHPNWDIRNTLTEAVRRGALDWYNHILENNASKDESDMGKLQFIVRVVQLLRTDLQKGIEFYDKIFQETANFSYAKELYEIYQEKIAETASKDVETICKSLKRLSYNGFQPSQKDSTEPLSVGTTLFELYLIIQRFVALGRGLNADVDNLVISNFHSWFYGGVAQWLDIAVFKALTRIEKAIELDTLKPVDNTVKYSSSAVDSLTIFYQIKVFWQQLNWPDVEGCYTFIAKIIDDICRCSVFYADKMSARVDVMGDTSDVYEKKFEVTKEWCLAINNMDYIRQSIKPFTEELGMEEVIQKLSDMKSDIDAERCKQTLETVIYNALDTDKNKIIELLEVMVEKMVPSMRRLLIEGAELFHQDSNSIDRVMMYFDNNLRTLHSELNEENFNKTLSIIWDNLCYILDELIKSNLEKRRPPSFFANLNETLKLMINCFKGSNEFSCPRLQGTQELLMLNGLETGDLIHRVHLDMFKEQQKTRESPFGSLTVRLKFHNNDLHVHIMNGRNLLEIDCTTASDSFVRVHLLPEEKFIGVNKPKTQTHHKNKFPLYDEKFEIVLTPEHHSVPDALVLFSVKDYDMMGLNNQYIGESFIKFSDIARTRKSLEELPQIQLQLIRPNTMDTDAIRALEFRQGDKLAKEFLKKFKQKMGPNTP